MRNRDSSKKKLGVLVSSLALVAVTAMAGVTGTAAWFTANRSQQVTAGKFTAYDPDSNLTITATAGQGTVTNNAKRDIQTKKVYDSGTSTDQNYLRDASVDVADWKVYSAQFEATSEDAATNPTGYTEINPAENGTLKTGRTTTTGSDIYYAFTWSYTFGYTAKKEAGSALFFDLTSSFDVTGTDTDIAAGFRIGFKSGAAGTPWFVWGKDAVADGNNANKYVSSTGKDDTATYPSSDSVSAESPAYQKYFNTESNVGRYDDEEITLAEAKVNTIPNTSHHHSVYLGQFTSGDSAVNSITVNVIAWYEGNDSKVTSDLAKATEKIGATMKFYARDLKA